MRKPIAILCLVLSYALVAAQHIPPQDLLFQPYAVRAKKLLDFYHIRVLDKDSSAIFSEINQIRKTAHQNKDEDLLLETGLMYAHYYYYRDDIYPFEQIVRILDSLSELGRQYKKIWLEAMAENMLALVSFRQGAYEKGFNHHRNVYTLIKDISPLVFPHKQNCLLQISSEHYRFRDYPESIFYMKEALEATPPWIMDPRVSLNAMNTIGLAYQHMGKLDSADLFFQQTIQEAQLKGNTTWECIATGNLGQSAFLRKDYNNAIPLLEKDLHHAVSIQDWGLAAGALLTLCQISWEKEEQSNAWQQLQTAKEYVYRSKQYHRYAKLYPLLARAYSYKGISPMAVTYFDSALFVQDSLERYFNTMQLVRAHQKLSIEQYKSEMKQIESQRQINLLERNILMGAICLLMIISIIVYKRQQQKAHLSKKELIDASRQLQIFSRNITEKNRLIETLQEQRAHTNDAVIEQLQKSTILTDDEWDYFRDLFEKAHPGYLNRLKQRFPGLTPAETRFLVLTRLGLSNKEMAAMLGVGTDAIRQIRSRARKKIDLSDDINLEALANAI